MSTQENTQESVQVPVSNNPFSESSWEEQTITTGEGQQEPKEVLNNTTTAEVIEEKKLEEEESLDPNEWIKQQFGFNTVDDAKKEIEELRKLRESPQTPAQIKFANEQSERLFQALVEGKDDDVYGYLSQKRSLDRLEKLELKEARDAAEIIKASLQFKHKDLTPEEVNFLYNKRYSIPEKPKQGIDQEEEDYVLDVENWQRLVKEKEQEMIIEAKLARPELAKYKSELVMPELAKKETVQQPEIDPEFETKVAEWKSHVFQQIESDASKFNGYNVTYKDEAVEIPIAFKMTDEERSNTIKLIRENVIGQNYNFNDYFNSRWFDDKGNPKVEQMMHDVYLINNSEKVFQKFANEAATQRLVQKNKEISNIKINPTPQGSYNPQTAKGDFDKMAAHFWGQS